MSESSQSQPFPELKQDSLGRKRALEVYETKWWEGLDNEAVFLRQIQTVELICPWETFHKATEEAVGSPVWSHEFANAKILWNRYQSAVQFRKAWGLPADTPVKTVDLAEKDALEALRTQGS